MECPQNCEYNGLTCNKFGSRLICIDGSCACALPKLKKFVFMIMIFVLLGLMTLKHFSSKKKRTH